MLIMPSDGEAIEQFLEMLAAEAGASQNTLLAYRSDLRAASAILNGGLAAATTTELTQLGSNWQNLAKSSLSRSQATLRRFFGFLVDEALRNDDPSNVLPKPATSRSLPKILSHDDIALLFLKLTDG